MRSKILYERVEKDFIKPKHSDKWGDVKRYGRFLSKNFKERSMGVVCDNSYEISRVYTAVFPEDQVMQKILDDKSENAMLFLHHPLIWDIRGAPRIFESPKTKYLNEFKKRKISIYVLHTSLDDYGEYSTSLNLSKSINIKPLEPAGGYFGAHVGLIGRTKIKDIIKLKDKFQKAMGHKVSFYDYGDHVIQGNKVGVFAGGGNQLPILKELYKRNINVLITGITRIIPEYQKSVDAHKYAKKYKINILGGTHYSTEKFACQKMCDYFKKLGLISEFVPGKPIMEDL